MYYRNMHLSFDELAKLRKEATSWSYVNPHKEHYNPWFEMNRFAKEEDTIQDIDFFFSHDLKDAYHDLISLRQPIRDELLAKMGYDEAGMVCSPETKLMKIPLMDYTEFPLILHDNIKRGGLMPLEECHILNSLAAGFDTSLETLIKEVAFVCETYHGISISLSLIPEFTSLSQDCLFYKAVNKMYHSHPEWKKMCEKLDRKSDDYVLKAFLQSTFITLYINKLIYANSDKMERLQKLSGTDILSVVIKASEALERQAKNTLALRRNSDRNYTKPF